VTAGTPSTASAQFAITPIAGTLTLQQNFGGTDAIAVSPLNGFSGTVTLSASGAPPGVQTAVVGNTLIVYPPLSTPTGTYPLTIVGTSGSSTATASVLLSITPGAVFSLSASSPTLGVARGNTGTDAISIVPANGFNASVTLTAGGLPAGSSIQFSPSSTTTSSSLNVSVGSTTVPGTYPITITGAVAGTGNSNAFTESTVVNLTVS